jgi:pimeloyl-ACP methyl ester carboxylesterase
MNGKKHWMALLLFVNAHLLHSASSGASIQSAPRKELPSPGEVFLVDGHSAFIIPAKVNSARTSKPWVWYAPTLPGLPGKEEEWMFDQFLDAGIAIAGIDVGESFGSPAGRKLFTTFHAEMTGTRGYSSKPVLLGRSRGGLMTLSWAAENPDKVAGFAGIYPVCNIASYPGIAKAAGAYEMKPEELDFHLKEHNPVDRLARLARTGVPLFAIHGDVDAVVPLAANSGLVKERYTALGGSMQLIIPPGQGHNMWPGFFRNQELVDFVKAQAGPTITLFSPLDLQVIQRSSKNKGTLIISGEVAGATAKTLTIEARLIVDGQPGRWRRLSVNPKRRSFEAHWNAPAGGWHRLEVRMLSRADVIAESVIEHVGMGDVFVIAGQSNSANHGAEKQKTRTGLVASFDGKRWRPAHDPQPGASGGGGSFIPPFGDAMAERFHVPVGIVACGVGATSVREWLPMGARFPNPPTLTDHVRQLPGGGWESKGLIFSTFGARMKQLGPRGFRAVLWHQGESDANQDDATRTLPGHLYRDYLEQLIRASRREIGWNAPWFVAQVSYHVPGDEASPDIRAAQAALWKKGFALEGPDSDALKGDLRENGGQGVHFSGPGLREHAACWVDKVAPWMEKK